MNYNKKNVTRLAGIFYILFGVLCIILRSEILNFMAYLAGFALIAYGIFLLVRRLVMPGVFMLVLGALVLLTGWFLVFLLIYLIAVLLILAGIEKLVRFAKNKAVNDSIFCLETIRAVLFIACGVLFVVYPLRTMSLLFVVVGAMLIVMGIMALFQDSFY